MRWKMTFLFEYQLRTYTVLRSMYWYMELHSEAEYDIKNDAEITLG